jgi:hypothetical protein
LEITVLSWGVDADWEAWDEPVPGAGNAVRADEPVGTLGADFGGECCDETPSTTSLAEVR